jgi:hypothetical protein
MFDDLTTIVMDHMGVDQATDVITASIRVNFVKQNASVMDNNLNIDGSHITIPSMCDLIAKTMKPTETCGDRVISQKSAVLTQALTGNNGDNVTNIGLSKSVSFSLYDEDKNEIPINNLVNPIEFWIPKDPNMNQEPFKLVDVLNSTIIVHNGTFVNTTNSTSANYSLNFNDDGFYLNGIKLNGTNISLHIQIKPENISIGFLVLAKFGDNPILKIGKRDYSYYDLFCPERNYTNIFIK